MQLIYFLFFLKFVIFLAEFLTKLPTSLTDFTILSGVRCKVLIGLLIVSSISSSNTSILFNRLLRVLNNIGIIIMVNSRVKNKNRDIIVPTDIMSLLISSEHLHFSLVKYLHNQKHSIYILQTLRRI